MRTLVAALLVGLSALACIPSASPTVSAAVLKSDFGVIHWGPLPGFDPRSAPTVRGEGETTTTANLVVGYFNEFHGSVAPDGRRAIYTAWRAADGPWALYLLDGSRPTEQRRLLELSGEIPSNIVWASDGSAVAFVVTDGGPTQGVAPKYAAIRTLDLASGKVTEQARISDGSWYRIIGWDRSSGNIAAFVLPHGGASSSYVVLGPGGTRTVPIGDGRWGAVASPDARTVAGVRCEGAPTGCSLWTWPLADFAARMDQRLPTGLSVGLVGWRPGSNEVALYTSNVAGGDSYMELWSAAGGRRTVHRFAEGRTPPGATFFRADGSALFLPGSTVVDLATGATTALPLLPPGVSSREFPAASIRLGAP